MTPPEAERSKYIGFERHKTHPVTYAEDHYNETLVLQREKRNVYSIQERQPGDENPPEFAVKSNRFSAEEIEEWDDQDFESLL